MKYLSLNLVSPLLGGLSQALELFKAVLHSIPSVTQLLALPRYNSFIMKVYVTQPVSLWRQHSN